MTFDFYVERRLPETAHRAYVDYEGNIVVEYEEYFNMGGSATREIEFSIEEIKALLKVAEGQATLYETFKKENY